jgi:hypothetical protein
VKQRIAINPQNRKPIKDSVLERFSEGSIIQHREPRAVEEKKTPTKIHRTIQTANKAPVNVPRKIEDSMGYSLVTSLFSK